VYSLLGEICRWCGSGVVHLPKQCFFVDDGGGGGGRRRRFELSDNFQASYSLDIWAFGQLMFETLVGKPLF